jgi:hypothetical protein
MAQCIGCAVIDRGIYASGSSRQDCNGAKQFYGNRRRVNTVCDLRFHSAFADFWFYLFLRKFLPSVAQNFKNPLGRVRITRIAQGAERAKRLSEKLGRIKLRLGTGYGA